MSMSFFTFWFIAGLVAAGLLVWFASKFKPRKQMNILGISLVIAAVVYVFFALFDWRAEALLIELGGVLIFGFIYWYAKNQRPTILGIGWLVHPIWDVLIHWPEFGPVAAPIWYVIVCISFDLVVGVYCLLLRSRLKEIN